MDDSPHGVSTSPIIKRSDDENEQNYRQIGANLQNLRKSMEKNYMSPTISAASKAITPRKILAERDEASEPSSLSQGNYSKAITPRKKILAERDEALEPSSLHQGNYSKTITPRKKILAERNEALEPSSLDTNVQKISNFEKSNDCLCQDEPKCPSVSQCHGDEKEADLSSKTYDPSMNYLSPFKEREMDDSPHSISTSPIIKRSNDENEQNYQQMGANLRNLRKPMAKNYLLPTSKAIAPRKILAERNEALEPGSLDTNVQKISNFERSNDGCQTEPKSPSVSQCHGDEKEADLSSKPYDPLMNYLSPRPQFLRYNPNRRREIFRGQEDGTGEEVDGMVGGSGSFDSLRGSFDKSASDTNCGSSISGGDSLAQEGKEMEESDEEEIEEGEKEKKCCNLKGVFKALLLLAVFVLSTMFISSINSSEPLSDDYCKVQNHTLETDFVKNPESRDYFSHQREGRQKGLMELNNNLESNFLKEEENFGATEGVEEENHEEIKRTDELKEAASLESGEVDDVELDETDDLGGEIVEPQIEEVFTRMVETMEKVEFFEDHQTPKSSEHHDSCFYTSSCSGIEVSPDEEVRDRGVENFEIVEIGMLERILKQMNTEFSFKVLTGVLSISTIIASLLLCTRLRPDKTTKKDSSESVLVKQEKVNGKDSSSLPSFPYTQERRRSVLPTREDENIDEVYSFGKNPSPSIHSIEKDPEDEEYSESRAPTVEYLGEFAVREIRSSAKKSTSKGSEEETLSNYSVSSAKKIGGKSHSVSVQAQQDHSEFSIVDSPSCGSYTAEKEIVKKVVSTTSTRRSSRKGEVMTTTPVRRSSRIRNLMSP